MITIAPINGITILGGDDRLITLPGWAFIDEGGHTIIQVYGRKKMEYLKTII